MPDIVTFDGPSRTIVEISAGGDNELDLVEIYSEWKEWVRTSDNSKFLQAFSVIGGDPITLTQNLGSVFFLENGWRIRPAELDHKLTIVGDVFTREPGESVYLPTLGAFTVNAETQVSALVRDISTAGSGASITETHIAAVYSPTTSTFSFSVWLVRAGTTVTNPTAMTLTLSDSLGAVVAQYTEATTGVTLAADGWYSGSALLALNVPAVYFADVELTDSEGTINTLRALVRAA